MHVPVAPFEIAQLGDRFRIAKAAAIRHFSIAKFATVRHQNTKHALMLELTNNVNFS